jgi:hypothetical protein
MPVSLPYINVLYRVCRSASSSRWSRCNGQNLSIVCLQEAGGAVEPGVQDGCAKNAESSRGRDPRCDHGFCRFLCGSTIPRTATSNAKSLNDSK